MDEGRKRVLAIIAGILIARHLKNPEDLRESRPSPRTESLVASAVQWHYGVSERPQSVHPTGYPIAVGFSSRSHSR